MVVSRAESEVSDVLTVLVLYRRPNDPQRFDRLYFERHAPLARALPGLVSFEVSRGPVAADEEIHLVAQLRWETREAFDAAMQTPEAAASQESIDAFAAGSYSVLVFETVAA
jgi:uncharacterized protein (TIGR02118 family)